MQLKKAVLVAGAGGIIDEAAAAAAVRGAALYRPRVCSVSPSLACQVRGRWRRWMLYRDEKVAIVRLGFGTARRKMLLELSTNPKPFGTIVDRAAI
jgi:hypothetical protein